MPKRFHSSLILVVVFCLGLAAGIVGMVWAWPGLHARFFPHHRETFIHRMQRTLELTPQQVTQVQGVFKDLSGFRHQVHLKYEPDYARVCSEFTQVRQQEGDAYFHAPERQRELDQLQAIMSASQWQKFQSNNGKSRGHGPLPDLCRHLEGRRGNTAPKTSQPAPPAGKPQHY